MKTRFPLLRPSRQGLLIDATLPRQSLRLILLVAILGFVAGLLPVGLRAQDDLSVPGLTGPGEAGKPPGQGSAEELVTEDDTTLLGLIGKGGWAMWILGAFSFAVVGLAIYCGIDLRKENFCPNDLQTRLREEWSAGNLEGITEAVDQNPATLARMTASVAEYIGETGYSTDDNDLLRGMMAEAGQKNNRKRARTVNYFSVIAQASPMMGLLGTVSGMIKAFGSLGKSGMAKPEVLAEHISEALVTTATGLIIALPAIFLYFFFRDRIEELIMECEDFGGDMLTILRRSAFAAAEESAGEDLAGRESIGGAGGEEPDLPEPDDEEQPGPDK